METFLVKELEIKLAEGSGREFINTAEEIIANEFIEFGSSGKIYDKLETLNSYSASRRIKTEIRNYTEKELSCDVILVHYRGVIRNEKGEEAESLRSSVWKKIEGSWKIVFHQGTQIGRFIS